MMIFWPSDTLLMGPKGPLDTCDSVINNNVNKTVVMYSAACITSGSASETVVRSVTHDL